MTFEPLEPRVLLSGDVIAEATHPLAAPLTHDIASSALVVTALQPTSSGVTVAFSRPVDPVSLNLYDAPGTLGSPDLSLVGQAHGPVTGSLVLNATGDVATFIKTGGALAPDVYTLTLRSGAAGFHDASGVPLVNRDGVAAGDYVNTFTVTAGSAVVLSVPDFARGAGEGVDVPATATGLPVRLSDGAGVLSAEFTVRYDPALLRITGATLGTAMPAESSVHADLDTSGVARLTVTMSRALDAGPIDLVTLTADVPTSAPYGSAEILDVGDARLNAGALLAKGDDGVHVAAYPGDVSGNGTLTSADAQRVLRVVVRLDSAFTAYPLIDPRVIGDITGNGVLSSLDAARILQETGGHDRPELPAIPTLTPVLEAGLASDTGASATDHVTSDATVAGRLLDGGLVHVLVGVDGAAATVDLSHDLRADGSFTLTAARLAQLGDGTLPDGDHRLHLEVRGLDGALSSAMDVGFTLDTVAPSAPSVRLAPGSDTGPRNDDGITSLTNVTIEGSAEPGMSVRLLRDGLVAASTTAGPSWQATLMDITAGRYSFAATAYDLAGNASATSPAVVVTVDTTAPAAPVFALAASSATAGPTDTTAARVTLSGRTDPNVDLQLVAPALASTSTGTGDFAIPSVGLAVGDNLLTLRAMDFAGNASEASQIIRRLEQAAQGDAVLEWNHVLLETIRLGATTPPEASRAMAMAQVAVYDALNAIDGVPGYMVTRTAPPGASPSAAVAAAAHRVLTYLFPVQQRSLDDAFRSSLGAIPDGAGKSNGISLGEAVAGDIIALRSTDGFNRFVDYSAGNDPGDWQPTPPAFAVPLLPQWATLTPFAMTSPSQFLPPGPPSLDSAEWTTAFNEVKAFGRATGSTRTAEQTQIARFWADGLGTYTPPGHWNQIAEQIALGQANSLSENARLFAELDVALADAAIVAWNAKYTDGFWRPITAIQHADTDGNPDTEQDRDWSPFLITPNFPEYVSGHSTFSGAAAEILTALLGPVGFTTSSIGLPGVERTFSSFQAAAEEAGRSRVYGGIHYEFSDEDGLAAGRALANFVLQRFSVASDTQPPALTVETPSAGAVVADNVTIRGRALDALSGLASLQARLDAADFAPIAFDGDGRFGIATAFALDGTADGAHRLRLHAVDNRGNASDLDFAFTLDTRAPALTITAPTGGAALGAGARLSGAVDGTGSAVTRLTYVLDSGRLTPLAFDAGTGAFDAALDLSRIGTGVHVLQIVAQDAAGLVTTSTVGVTLPVPGPFTITSHKPVDGANDVGVTFRPQVFFSRPVDGPSLNATNFYATDATGQRVDARIVTADSGLFAWLFFAQPLASAATITVHVDGATIPSFDGVQYLDADDDGAAGGTLTYSFTTVSLASIPGTTLSGYVVDPGPDLVPMTFDDIRAGADQILSTADDVHLLPIAGVRVFILGREDRPVVTDANGFFRLEDVPVGDVKLSVDGMTATNAPEDFYFPEMVMDVSVTNVGGDNGAMRDMDEVYLPRLRQTILTTVSGDTATTIGLDAESASGITPEQQHLLTIEVQPQTLIGADGQRLDSGQVGISLVPPELVRDMLPPGVLQHTFDITVQAPGISNFSTPAQMTFPNVFNAAPGTRLNFLSFDHTTGRLVIEGTATVSADGLTVTTDPDSGITHPGWHGLTPPGSPGDGKPPLTPPPPPRWEDIVGTLQSDYEAKRGTGAEALAHQIACIAQESCAAADTWGGGFIKDVFAGIANDVNHANVGDFLPNLISPAGETIGDVIPNWAIGDVFHVGDISAVIGGFGRHFPYELLPAFVEHAKQLHDDLDGNGVYDHEDFFNNAVLPCFDEVVSAGELSPWAAAAAKKLVPTAASALRETIWALRHVLNPFDPDPPLPPSLTKADLYVPELAQLGTLSVDAGDAFFVSVGQTTGLHVQRRNPDGTITDLTGDPHNLYFAVTADDYVTIAGDGRMTIRDTISPLPGLTPGLAVIVRNGNDIGIGQFAVTDVDSDGDLLVDSYEARIGLDPHEANDPDSDLDRDGVSDFKEALLGINPLDPDTDHDGISDGNEVAAGMAAGQRDYLPAQHAVVFGSAPAAGPRVATLERHVSRDFAQLTASTTAHYFAVANLDNDFVIRGMTDTTGQIDEVFLQSNARYRVSYFAPQSQRIGSSNFVTPASGRSFTLPFTVLGLDHGFDADGDGLSDQAEFVIGTSRNARDSDRDGINDLVEIQQGLNPLDGQSLATGVVGAASVRGEARDVVLQGSVTDPAAQTAYVATGTHGLAIVDVSLATRPVVFGELDLPGLSTGVSVDRTVAAVAAGSAGLHIVDVSIPTRPTLIQTVQLPDGANDVVALDGIAYVASGRNLIAIDLDTRDTRQTLDLGATITDLASEGRTLYAMSQMLHVISVDNLEMRPRGALAMPQSAGKVFVGNGIAYATATNFFPGGFETADVSDPDHPVLISASDVSFTNQSPKNAIAANGSGVAVLVGNPRNAVSVEDKVLDVMSVLDPADTNAFRTRFALPATPQAVAIAGGLAFVADDTSGLQVVNFLSIDTSGQPPAITISSDAVDQDPGTPGVQVIGGTTLRVVANVSDDVQVRNVELLVDGQVVRNDVSFPWDLLVNAPSSATGRTATIQVRATDTGGNSTLSNALGLDIVPDTFPPHVVDTKPTQGQKVFFVRSVDLRFDEPIDPAVLNATGVHLANLGRDHVFGTADDTAVAIRSLTLRDFGRSLSIVPSVALAEGDHRLTIDPGVIADVAGNHIATPITLDFAIRPASEVHALRGTPAAPQAPSANVGQEIRIFVPGADGSTRLIVPTIDSSSGTIGSRQIAPSRVAADGQSAFFVVPDDAATGDISATKMGSNNFTDLPNWVVTRGSIDLIGPGTYDPLPGHGLYLDLDGTTGNAGRLESRQTFVLDPGTYELRFALAGSQRGDVNAVHVSLGDAFDEAFTLGSGEPFQTITRTITVASATEAKLVFDHDGGDYYGLLLDDVRLANATSGDVLLADGFDFQFPDGPFLLQIVPTLTDSDIGGNQRYHGGSLTLRGSGFAEGATTVFFGSDAVIDSGPFSGPDIYGYYRANDSLYLQVPDGVAFGPITISTPGGRSDSFPISVDQIVATAASGTPADPSKPSANPGQAITLLGSGFDATTDVVFQTQDSNGTRSERIVRPSGVGPGGTQITVIVPTDVAITGAVDVVGDQNNSPLTLQVVPVLENVDVYSLPGDGSVAYVQLRGAGFVEGTDSRYTFGATPVTDADPFSGPDVFGGFVHDNDAVNLVLPLGDFFDGAGPFTGPVTVTTAGGTSAPFRVAITRVEAVALSGTPADPAQPSANAGQAITLHGSGFTAGTDLLAAYVESGSATRVARLLTPVFVDPAGTEATFVIPDYFSGALPLHILGAATAPALQIVPTLDAVDVYSTDVAQLRGSGFVEAGSTYRFDGGAVVDSVTSDYPDVYGGFVHDNDAVNLRLPVAGAGPLTVTTAGGTSAPIAWNAIHPNLGILYDVAADPSSGDLFVATYYEIRRLDAATGQTRATFPMPATGAANVGLQISPAPFSLAGSPVPAGSLLVTNGYTYPDQVFALDPASGAVLASLTLAASDNFDPVAGLFHPGLGKLLLLDPNANQLAVVDPASGAIERRVNAPVDISNGGLALDPVSANVWLASRQSSVVYEIDPANGTVVRSVDLSPRAIDTEISGLAFDGAGRLLASSTSGVVYVIDLGAPDLAPTRPQPTLARIEATSAAGTPADPSLASANAGQIVTLVGANFRMADLHVLVPLRNAEGQDSITVLRPLTVSADGTRAQVLVPDQATTGLIRVTAYGDPRNLGFSGYPDAIYRDVTLDFTPSAATADLAFSGQNLQNLDDESWGLDNVRVTDAAGTTVFTEDFEHGAAVNWSRATTSAAPVFTRFSGRFANDTQTLHLSSLTAGQTYRLHFDLFVLDSWDAGSDVFEVDADGRRLLREPFTNFPGATQFFGAAGNVPLQIVPTITGLSGRPGSESAFDLFGSGFMEAQSTLRIGGVSIPDRFVNQAEADVYNSARANGAYRVVAPLSLDGPISISTPGGSSSIAGPNFPAPAFVNFTGLVATAAQGTPANANVASANTGQLITLAGQGFTSSTLVQFDAIDPAGTRGRVTVTGNPNGDGTQLTVEVPALAHTGVVRVIGSDRAVPLQVVPTLRALGGTVSPGNPLVLEGSGLTGDSLTVTVDGQAVGALDVRTTFERGSDSLLNRNVDQQLVRLVAPSGIGAGAVTVATDGGRFTLRAAASVTSLADLAVSVDPGDTLATARVLTDLAPNRRLTVTSRIGDGAFPTRDVDVYRVTLSAGDVLSVNVSRFDNGGNAYVRVFDAAGAQLIADGFSGPDSNPLIAAFRAPASGIYFVGVSGWYNYAYDPNVAGSGYEFVATGAYRLTLARLAAGASTLTGIVGTAASGTPAESLVPSANVGDTITLRGSNLSSRDRVVFTGLDSNYSGLNATLVNPASVAADGTSLTVVVPNNATTGQVRLERENVGLLLQIVPTLADIDLGSFQPYHGGNLTLYGSGFAEGVSAVGFGGGSLVDTGFFSGPDVSDYARENGALGLRVPDGMAFGPITVTTPGGRSTSFPISLDQIVATTASGAPADPAKPSANPGQAIVLRGHGFDATTDVVFPTIESSSGTRSERNVRPAAVTADGTELTVIVPADVAVTGAVHVAGAQSAITLQIVPVLENVDVYSLPGDGSVAYVQLRGAGFVEGTDSRYTFGATPVTDADPFSGPDVFSGFVHDNDAVNLVVPLGGFFDGAGPFAGPVTVTTAGGTSAPFRVAVTRVEAVALSGTPADPAQPSANAGQAITLRGSGFTAGTDLLAAYVESGSATRLARLLTPVFVDPAGTQATFVIPDYFNGAFPLHILGAAATPTLQIVPTLDGADVYSTDLAQLRGSGFVEASSTYRFDGSAVIDTGPSNGPDVYGGFVHDNDAVNLRLPGAGALSVTTAGGTSAPRPWTAVHPDLGTLYDVAVDPASGDLFVATYSEIRRLDAATGQTRATFPMPVTGSANVGLHVTPAPFALAGSPVPAGSLLVTNGYTYPDQVFALDPATGALLASLTLSAADNFDPVAGLFHPTLGKLLLLDPNANQLVVVDPASGAIDRRLTAPVDIGNGGLALDPTSANVWLASNQSSAVFALDPATGAVVRTVELAPLAIETELTGLAFDPAGRLLASSNRGVVYVVDLAAPDLAPTRPQPALARIEATRAAGTPADASIASANAGQVVTLVGANFRMADLHVLVPLRNAEGQESVTILRPLAVSADGTRAQVLLPDQTTTGLLRVNAYGDPRNVGFSGYPDALYRDVTLDFTPTATTADLAFSGQNLQNLDDEAWGLDNVRVADAAGTTVFADDFEHGAAATWSRATTAETSLFSRFSGRFGNDTQTLHLTGLTAGQTCQLHFDLLVLDSWDAGSDIFEVDADGRRLLREPLTNFPGSTQFFGATGHAALQIVPTITGLSGRPGSDSAFDLFGSGFMEAQSTLRIGGVSLPDRFANQYEADVYNSARANGAYRFVAPLTLDGPIAITTPGGSFSIAGPTFAPPPFVNFTGLVASAVQGTPADAAIASANTGQVITLTGQGFTSSTLVQFDALDPAGTRGRLTGTGTPNGDGTRLSVEVPALAHTGGVRIVGSDRTIPLQIVPTLRALGGSLSPGSPLLLEGSGLTSDSLTLTAGGQAAGTFDVRTTFDRGYDALLTRNLDQQLLHFTAPDRLADGRIVGATDGGSFTLSTGLPAAVPEPDVSPAADPGDTLAAAMPIALGGAATVVSVDQRIGDGDFPSRDVDLYRLTLRGGDVLTVNVSRFENGNSSYVRLFDAAGAPLTADGFSGPDSNPLIAAFHVPVDGTYVVGVSGWYNYAYDPTVGGSGYEFVATGAYRLTVTRLAAGSSTLTGISATADSGTPAQSTMASANVGQTITLTGSNLSSRDRVVFTGLDSNYYGLTATIVNPAAVAGDGSSLTVVVPDNATTGQVRLERENVGLLLQVVPTLRDVDLGQFQRYHGGNLSLYGSGFAEGVGAVAFGGDSLVDTGFFSGLDVYDSFRTNGALGLRVPDGVAFGPISVTTPGGTSTPFDIGLDAIVATATSGTPADPSPPSANPGQAIVLRGHGFDPSTDVVFPTIESSAGTRGERNVRPSAVTADGTELTVTVPVDVAVTGAVRVVGDRNAAAIPLQIVPLVDNLNVYSIAGDGSLAYVQLRGAGFVEGNDARYTFGGTTVTDADASSGPDVYAGFAHDNDAVNLVVPLDGVVSGAVTVTTAGGTSAPFVVNVTSVDAVAATGTPADPSQPSANPGQTITFHGSGLTAPLRVLTDYIESGGGGRIGRLFDLSVDPTGTEASFVAPDYFSGAFPVHVLGSSFAATLQIVPLLENVDVTSVASDRSSAGVQLRGRGFVESHGSGYRFGDTVVTDAGAFSGPDVFGGFQFENDAANLTLPLTGSFDGPVTVITAGGTSAPFTRTLDPTGIVATSGTPVDVKQPSANTGQTITFHGAGFTLATDFVTTYVESGSGTRVTRLLNPSSVEPDGTQATLVVPDYYNGAFPVHVLGAASAPLLQIVPVLDNVDVYSLASDGSSAEVQLRGRGFVEGHDTTYLLGDTVVTDANASSGPNVFGGFRFENDAANLSLPLTGSVDGDVTVTTAGGVSAPFTITLDATGVVAASGAPTNSAQPSANAGQTLTFHGAGLSTATDFITYYVDGNGTRIARILNPSSASSDGTQATLVVPDYYNGAFPLHVLGAGPARTLQIVPVVDSVDVTGTGSIRLRGSGFVEADATYTLGSGVVTDTQASTGPNVFGGFAHENDAVDLTVPQGGAGSLIVATAGGSSARIAWNVIFPNLGTLYDVAADATSGDVFVATSTQFRRIDPASGATLATFTLPGGSSGNIGLQVVPAMFTLGSTSVPAGSLLVVNGAPSPDRVFALSGGSTIASLTLQQNLDAVAGVYHPGLGKLIFLDPNANQLVVVTPATGATERRVNAPVDVSNGGLAVDPVSANVWVASAASRTVYEVNPTDGSVVRSLDLSARGIHFDLTGLAFDTTRRLLASSTNGLVYVIDVPGVTPGAPSANRPATVTVTTNVVTKVADMPSTPSSTLTAVTVTKTSPGVPTIDWSATYAGTGSGDASQSGDLVPALTAQPLLIDFDVVGV